MHDRVCNGTGGAAFNPQAFAQLRQTLCPADKALDPATLPAQVADRFKGTDGKLDPARLTQFRTRVCSIDPAQFAARQGQQGQVGGAASAANGAQPAQRAEGGGAAPAANGAPPAQQAQASGRGSGAGGGGFFPGGGGRGGNGGRWNISLSDTIELENKVLVSPTGPLLDLLHGDALTGGVSRNTLSLEGGVFYNGVGLRFNGSYKSGTHVEGTGAPGSSDLTFGDLFTLDLRLFADLGRQEKLVKASPFFKNTRLSFNVTNVFDARQKVTDQNGVVPLRYQPYLIDPTGRSFQIEIRKLF
jgi:hypothetical protein